MSCYYDEVIVVVGRPCGEAAEQAFCDFHEKTRAIFRDVDETGTYSNLENIVGDIVQGDGRMSFLVGAQGTKTPLRQTTSMKRFREFVASVRAGGDRFCLQVAVVDMGNDCNEGPLRVVEYDAWNWGKGPRPYETGDEDDDDDEHLAVEPDGTFGLRLLAPGAK